MRMGCISSTPADKTNRSIETDIRSTKKKHQSEIKILLLGTGESGKSTVFKQMKIIQDHGGYSKEELLEFKYIIFGNCITQMKCILEAAHKLNISVANPENSARMTRLTECPSGGDAWSTGIATDIKALWGDQGIREVYGMRDKHYQLNDCAAYFFDNIDRFMVDSFVPTTDDILRVRVRTTGIQEAEFKFDDIEIRTAERTTKVDSLLRSGHCCYVLCCFEYDQSLREDGHQNRMKESLLLFDEVCNSVWFRRTSFILFLNKTDLFKDKIARVDLTSCFPNYTGGCNFEHASTYIKQKFLEQNKSEHHIYPHFTCAISTENIEFVFKCVRDTVLKLILREVIVY